MRCACATGPGGIGAAFAFVLHCEWHEFTISLSKRSICDRIFQYKGESICTQLTVVFIFPPSFLNFDPSLSFMY